MSDTQCKRCLGCEGAAPLSLMVWWQEYPLVLPMSTGSLFLIDVPIVGYRVPQLSPYHGDHLCYSCMGWVEVEYVCRIVRNDLPLYVNHVWVTEAGRVWYLGRF